MKSIKKFILQKLAFLEPKKLDKNNSLELFLNTLTTEEKDKNFLDLNDSQKVQYTQALFKFQIEAMVDISEATFKALTMFAIKLHKENINEFVFEQSFYGTKENLKEELFYIKFTKIDHVEALYPPKPIIEYADEDSEEPRKKSDSLFNQSDMILEMLHKLNGQFPMKPNNELPLRTSALLLTAELMSQCNFWTLDLALEGLIEGNTPLNSSFKVQALRKEFALNLEEYPVKKKKF